MIPSIISLNSFLIISFEVVEKDSSLISPSLLKLTLAASFTLSFDDFVFPSSISSLDKRRTYALIVSVSLFTSYISNNISLFIVFVFDSLSSLLPFLLKLNFVFVSSVRVVLNIFDEML
jgi:hypothetical protein